jgi:hypothetical protein
VRDVLGPGLDLRVAGFEDQSGHDVLVRVRVRSIWRRSAHGVDLQ